jgi:amidohydrolase
VKSTLLTFLLVILPVQPLLAEISHQQIDEAASLVQPQVVEWRRWFHEFPELSNREVNTGARIAEILTEMGLEPKTGIALTGVTALIKGGKPGPLVAIRADIDGLPVTEQTGLPFASTQRSEYNGQDVGVMHACGHDAHMSMALGAAKILNDMKADLAGSVLMIFQPAEEGTPGEEEGGASLMLEEGVFEDGIPEAVFGIHVGLGAPGGKFQVKPGPMMAASDHYRITVKGVQTHGARPWQGVDPIVVASQIVMGLQSIASRQVDVTKAPSIISVGSIHAGVRYNVIPDQLVMEGTIRTFDSQMRDYIHEAIPHTASSIAASAGATIEWWLKPGPPALINDEELTAFVMPALERAAGSPVVSLTPQTVAEDFSEFSNVTPGVYTFLGSWPDDVEDTGQGSNHSPFFQMHEPYMEHGVKAFGHMVVDYLQANQE